MQMKKFINDPDNLTAELLEGLAMANPDILELGEDNMVINKKLAEADRVTIVTQGGSGHEPAIEGFVGEGMVDIDVVGDIFAAPGPQACVDAIKLADKGKGVLYIVLNHAGDMLTGNMTMKQCKKQGLNVVKVVTQEDVSNAPRENADDRRGLVGCIPTYKIAGAAAAEGMSLEEVAAVAQRFADNMATLAVAVRGATHPQTGTLLAELGDDEMEIGMGQHGEEGGGRQPMKSADETAAIMVNALVNDIGIQPGEKVMLIINGSGATTLMEQLHRVPRGREGVGEAGHRGGGELRGRDAHRAGTGRLPDVHGPHGRRAAAPVERPLQHAVPEEVANVPGAPAQACPLPADDERESGGCHARIHEHGARLGRGARLRGGRLRHAKFGGFCWPPSGRPRRATSPSSSSMPSCTKARRPST